MLNITVGGALKSATYKLSDCIISAFHPGATGATGDVPYEEVSFTCAKVEFSKLFGGFTSQNAVGGWLSPKHGLIEENVTVVSAFTDDHGLKRPGDVKAFAAKMGRALS